MENHSNNQPNNTESLGELFVASVNECVEAQHKQLEELALQLLLSTYQAQMAKGLHFEREGQGVDYDYLQREAMLDAWVIAEEFMAHSITTLNDMKQDALDDMKAHAGGIAQ